MELLDVVKEIVNHPKIDYRDRGKVVEIVIAEVLASQLDMPVSKLEPGSEPDYFRVNHKAKVLQAISKANEFIVLNIDQTCDTVYHIWYIRYCLVHVPNDPTISRMVMSVILHNSSHMPNVYQDVLKAYPEIYVDRWKLPSIEKEV